MKKSINLEQLAETLLHLDVHRRAILQGEIDNDWTQEDWARYRSVKNNYTHQKRLEERKKEGYKGRITFKRLRDYDGRAII